MKKMKDWDPTRLPDDGISLAPDGDWNLIDPGRKQVRNRGARS